MYKPQLQLQTHEQQALLAMIDACHSARSERDFSDHVYPLFRRLLPHQSFACGIGSTPENHILYCLNVNFPADYMRRVVDVEGRLRSPVARLWLEHKEPQYFVLDTLDDGRAETAGEWITAVKEYGFRNIVAHGLSDIKNKAASYFSFADVPQWGAHQISLLQVAVPHLHIALINIAPNETTDTGQPFTQREREVLHWMRLGKSNEEIGIILGISRWTAKVHVRNVLKKLHASTRAHAVAQAVEQGII